MGESSRVKDMYLKGVKEFIRFAKKNLGSNEFSCPCKRCRNGKCWTFKIVELNFVQWGFVDGYVFWKFHGEKEFPFVPEQQECQETISSESDPMSRPRLNDLIDDTYGFHVLQTD